MFGMPSVGDIPVYIAGLLKDKVESDIVTGGVGDTEGRIIIYVPTDRRWLLWNITMNNPGIAVRVIRMSLIRAADWFPYEGAHLFEESVSAGGRASWVSNYASNNKSVYNRESHPVVMDPGSYLCLEWDEGAGEAYPITCTAAIIYQEIPV